MRQAEVSKEGQDPYLSLSPAVGQAALAASTAPGFRGNKAPELQEDFSIHSPWAGVCSSGLREEERFQGSTLLAGSAALKSWRALHHWASEVLLACGAERA